MFQFRSLLWLMPFASFITGYLLISLVIKQPALQTPTLTGKTLDQAVLILSQSNLNIRIVGQKEDAQLPEGTILTQTPTPGSSIKEQQALYVTIAKKPVPLAMPHLLGKTETQAIAELETLSLHAKIYKIASDQPAHTVIAQSPEPGLSANDHIIMLYIATDEQKPILMPNLKNRPLDEVLSFLELHGITPTILHTPVAPDHRCTHCSVIDQRPLNGTFVKQEKGKPIQVQLQVTDR
jgi:beta-lactam-binding protein with PASTA domain